MSCQDYYYNISHNHLQLYCNDQVLCHIQDQLFSSIKFDQYLNYVIQYVSVNGTVVLVISLYSFIKRPPKTPVNMMDGGNNLLASISNVIITEQPLFSLTESATPTRLLLLEPTPFQYIHQNVKKFHFLIKQHQHLFP